MKITIRKTVEADFDDIFKIHAEAFGYDKEAELTLGLLKDPSSVPFCSLLAFNKSRPVGHVLFTAAHIDGSDTPATILAPLAIIPEMQKQGIGGQLIGEGLDHLRSAGVKLAFVLGHPSYYPKYGFIPAHTYGLQAPYPIPEIHNDAWMVQALGCELGSVQGKVTCADVLNKPEHWRE